MKSTLFRIVAAAGLVAGAAALGLAQETPAPNDPRGSEPQEHGRRLGRMGRRGHHGLRPGGRAGLRALGRLDLTDAQREQLRALHRKYREANREKGMELRELMRQRRQGGELSAEQQTRARELAASLRESRQSLRNESLGALTDEQRTRLEQLRNELRQRREEFRQRRQELRQRRLQQTPPSNIL